MARNACFITCFLLILSMPAAMQAAGEKKNGGSVFPVACSVADTYGNFGSYGGVGQKDEIVLDVNHPELWKLTFKSGFTIPLKAPFSSPVKTGLNSVRAISEYPDKSYPIKITSDITVWDDGAAIIWIVSEMSQQIDGVAVLRCSAANKDIPKPVKKP